MQILNDIIAKAHAPKGELIPILIKNIGGYWPERSHKTVHASDVTKADWCPKQFALMDVYSITQPDRYLPAGLKATFDIGNATSDIVRERWLGDRAVGHWRCPYCKATKQMTTKPQDICANGDPCDWKYVEPNFVDPVTAVSGSLDVLVNLNGSKLIITELKIMKGEDFDKLAAPLAEHRIRTSLYMQLVENSNSPWKGMIHTQRAKILYVSRGFGKKHPEHGHIIPFKEFDVKRDDEATAPFMAKPLALRKWRAGEGPMPSGVCPDAACTKAKGCPVRKQCWGLE